LPRPIAISETPADLGPLVARGAELYQWAQCHKCHGAAGQGDGEAARDQKDSWEFPIAVTDLTYKWLFKNGHEPRDTYRSLFAGLTGSSMRCSDQVIPDERQRWALVAYVHSFSPAERPALKLKDFKERYSQVVDAKGIIRR
jgi:cytochrome c